jgi:hypothetical protein
VTSVLHQGSYWRAARNPDGSFIYTSPDAQNNLLAKSENGQSFILSRTRIDTSSSSISGIDKETKTYLWDRGERWGAYLWKTTNPDGSATYTTPNGKKSINVRTTDNPSQPYAFQDVTAGGNPARGPNAAGAAQSGAKPNQPGGAAGIGQQQGGNAADGGAKAPAAGGHAAGSNRRK